ncbi:hypothetical protein AX774_g2039 [Zancudomyces culisetae]|uniref:Velvet domain-containing protein n=1 Tax=Zancudomyces culisetae TaxID=1213189 RepID=A0A1R1PTZ6_ZANCU|nr:hypothetical protein AX774_g2039 [Zancudomyces culisetae]|eukprot:OMH84440.1 hypothetical protein AX774_g2039 [Zancudomyces culisetae]
MEKVSGYNINVINFRDCITRGSQFTIACQLDINDADGNSVPADEFEGNVFVAHLSLLLENGEEVSSFIECSSSIFYEGNTVSEGFQDGGAILFEFENLKIHYPGSYCFKIAVFDMEQVLVGPM